MDGACDSPWPGSRPMSRAPRSLPGSGGGRKRDELFSDDSPHPAPWPGFFWGENLLRGGKGVQSPEKEGSGVELLILGLARPGGGGGKEERSR